MLNLKNTLDGYLKNVEVIGNTIQDANNLADIRSVGDKVEGQELYKMDIVSCGKNLFDATVCVDGYVLSGTKGEENNNASWFYSDYIKVKAGVTYRMGAYKKPFDPFYSCLYNEDKAFIRSNIGEVFTPSCDGYVRLSGLIEHKHVGQLEINSSITPYEPYKENKLEILSPVQLEKVGDVADRIICKDGVWGVEKNVDNIVFNGSEQWQYNSATKEFYLTKSNYIYDSFNGCISDKFVYGETGGNYNNVIKLGNAIFVTLRKDDITNVNDFKAWLQNNNVLVMFITPQPQFIPLPHDQQVKLRTFAGQTNIAFLTEIPGQIKAQVPKSLGATVNTHTEQIAELHNSLERVKKLEETTVSTIETGSNFTTVDATSNGYFEDVKLEGKTLVNKFNKTSWKKYGSNNTLTTDGDVARLERTVADGNVCYMALPLRDKFEVNGEYTIVLPHYKGNLLQASLYDRGNGFPLQVGMIYFIGNVGKIHIRTDKLTFSSNIELLFYTGDTVGNYLEISSNILILEGDHTNNPPSYFEGLMSVGQDVEEVSVESVNENLFRETNYIATGSFYWYYVDIHNLSEVSFSVKGCSKSQTNYSKLEFYTTDLLPVGNAYNQWNTVAVKDVPFNVETEIKCSITNKLNQRYLVIHMALAKDNNYEFKEFSVTTKATNTYANPKSNKKPLLYFNPTTETWEKPVLREWDTIEKHSDGKYYYHKRSGEITLNGSEIWTDATSNSANGYRLSSNVISSNSIFKGKLLCDNLNPVTTVTPGDSKNSAFTLNTISISTHSTILYVTTQYDVTGFKAWLKANPTTVVYQLAQEEVYECTNIDLMTYSGETNYIINSGAISPKSILKVHNNISNVVKILQEKVSLLENTFIAGLKSVLSGDMYSLATILYPEDFEQNDNTEQDIMVIPE